MRKIFLCFCSAGFLLSCNNEKEKPATTETPATAEKSAVELPYTASYSSNWSTDVSDADLKTVLMTYKDWSDGLSSVKIDMQGWQKMYATDKKETYIVTWYDETDTYKNGKVDAGSFHDINQLKDGKLIYYAQYKRPKK